MPLISYTGQTGHSIHVSAVGYQNIIYVEAWITTLPAAVNVIDSGDPKKVIRAGYWALGYNGNAGLTAYAVVEWGWLDFLHMVTRFVAPRSANTLIISLTPGVVASFNMAY